MLVSFAVSSLGSLQEVPLSFPKCQSGQGEFLPAGCSLELSGEGPDP